MSSFDFSPSSHLRAPSIKVDDSWFARWNNELGRYQFHNAHTGVTQPEFPLSDKLRNSIFSDFHRNFYGSWQMRTPTVSSILSKLESRLNEERNSESTQFRPCINLSKARRAVSEGNVTDISAIFADILEVLERETMVVSLQHSNHVHFLHERLREARAIIEKLTTTNSLVEELYQADALFPTNMTAHPNSASVAAIQTNISLLSRLPPTGQSIQFQPLEFHSGTSDFVSSSDMLTQLEPSQEPDIEVGISNEIQAELVTTVETSSARKRKRPSTKDPVKFKHECDTCGERFTRSTTLHEHKRTHNDERPFSCSRCSKSFARKKDKIRHEELHAGEKRFICDLSMIGIPGQCGRKFAREDGLVAHLRTERGWKCLQSSMDFESHIKAITREETGFRCKLTQLSCHAQFDNFVDLQVHVQDFANRKCSTEWLVKSFPRKVTYVRNPADSESLNSSDGEEPIASCSMQRTSQRQQEARVPSPDDASSVQRGNPEISLDIGHRRYLPFPDTHSMTIGTAQNDTAENEQVTTGSKSQDELYSTEEAPSDFDPFAGWVLSDMECITIFANVQPALLIDIVCATEPTPNYQIAFGRGIAFTPETSWAFMRSGVYRGHLELWNAHLIGSEGVEVSIVYTSDEPSKKTFPLGTLRYDQTTLGWKVIPSLPPALPANSQPFHHHEIMDNDATGVENPLSAISSNDDYTERSTAIDEVATGASIGRLPVEEPVLQLASTTDSHNFSHWMIVLSGFEEKQDDTVMIWFYLKPPDGKDPKLPSDFVWLRLAHPESAENYGSRWYLAECPFVIDRYVVSLKLELNKSDWFWKLPIAVHFSYGSDCLKLYIGTRRRDHEGRWKWTQALPGELCKCCVCV
jgi:hypothetical protein